MCYLYLLIQVHEVDKVGGINTSNNGRFLVLSCLAKTFSDSWASLDALIVVPSFQPSLMNRTDLVCVPVEELNVSHALLE